MGCNSSAPAPSAQRSAAAAGQRDLGLAPAPRRTEPATPDDEAAILLEVEDKTAEKDAEKEPERWTLPCVPEDSAFDQADAAFPMLNADIENGFGQADIEDKPVTLAEALDNTAFRSAILETVQIAAALSPSTLEKLGVHAIGMVLSLCAGAVNAVAFVEFSTYISHVSGVSTAIGLRMEAEQAGDPQAPARIVISFIFGAVLAGLFIPKATLTMGQARYEVVLFLVAATEVTCWWGSLHCPEMLAGAMGLQNALATSWSGAVLRTTHMTGTATDLGSALGRILSRFFRRGCSLQSYSDQDWDEHTVDRQKFVLMCCLHVSFISGGLLGAALYASIGLHALLVPAGLTTTLGVGHLAYCIMRAEPLATEKAAEDVFTRQLSTQDSVVGTLDAGAGDRQLSVESVQARRIQTFIRQISAASSTR